MEKLTTMMNALLASQAAQDQATQDQAAQALAAQNQAAQALAAQALAAQALASQNQAAQALAAQNQVDQAQVTVSQSAGTLQPIPTIASGSTTHPFVTGFSAGDVSNMFNEGFRHSGPPGFPFTPQHYMPQGYPWGMPLVTNEGVRPSAPETQFPFGQQLTPFFQTGQPTPQATVTYAAPLVHTA